MTTTLDDALAARAGTTLERDVATTVRAIAEACVAIAALIAEGPLAGDLAAPIGGNVQGEVQKALDVRANTLLLEACRTTPAFAIASEENEHPVPGAPDGDLLVAFDPLDGSSNIDVNMSIGTIFSILPKPPGNGDDLAALFLQPGRAQLAAGYVLYGPQTTLVLTFGAGTTMFTLDRQRGAFVQTNAAAAVPPTTHEYAINASNARHWPAPVRAYIEHCVAGATGPRGTDTNLRWIASLVAEAHRVLVRGGVFLYPADSRPGYDKGRLRMLYEAAPIALLIEQAGGTATTGTDPILDLAPAGLHGRTPFIFGSREEVGTVLRYHAEPDGPTAQGA